MPDEEMTLGYMVSMDAQCPLCDGVYQHDPDCELKTLPISLAASLGLEKARLEVKRRAEQKG
jgi:hypothetical protein